MDLDALYNDLLQAKTNTNSVNMAIWNKLDDIRVKYPQLFNTSSVCYLYIQKLPDCIQFDDFQITITVYQYVREHTWEFKVEKYGKCGYQGGWNYARPQDITREQLEQAFIDKIKKLTKESERELDSLMPLAKLLGVR